MSSCPRPVCKKRMKLKTIMIAQKYWRPPEDFISWFTDADPTLSVVLPVTHARH